ncbi:MAG: pilus assembly protein TadG-related protein [Proteocatella sp.]
MRFIFKENGLITIFVAIALVILFAFSAIVLDFGVSYIKSNELQNAADAAALVGAKKLPLDDDNTFNTDVKQLAENYVIENGVLDSEVVPVFDSNNKISGIRVLASEEAPADLVNILLGNAELNIKKKSKSKVFQLKSGVGLVPIGVNKDVFEAEGFDGSIVLDIDPSELNGVKYGWMFFDKVYGIDKNSNDKLKSWMLSGYDKAISLGDEMPWTNGSRSSTVLEYNNLIGREIMAPIYEVIDFQDGQNPKEDIANVRIVGFVFLRVEDFKPGGTSNKTMKATFIKYKNIEGETSENDTIEEYRVYSSKLVE